MLRKIHRTLLLLLSWRQFYIQVLLVSAVTSALSGIMLIRQNVRTLRLEQLGYIAEIEHISEVITPLVQGFDLVSLEAIGESLFSRSYVYDVRIVDRSGYPLFERNVPAQSTHRLRRYATDLILKDGDGESYEAGQIYVDIITMDNREIYTNATASAFHLFLILSALGIVTSSIYARNNITRPLRELSRAMDQTLETGEPVKTKSVSAGFIGQFQKQFNSMQGRLFSAQDNNKRQRQLIREALRSVQQSVRLYDCGTYIDYNKIEESFHMPENFPQTREAFEEYCSTFSSFDVEDMPTSSVASNIPGSDILYDLDFSLNKRWHNVKAIRLGDGVHALILTDTTRTKLIEKTLQHARKMELIGSLSTGIAHDFNNVLGIMVGHLELMKMWINDPEKLNDSRLKALAASRRGAAIVNSLLSFSRKNVERVADVMATDILESIASISRTAIGSNIRLITRSSMNARLRVDTAMLESSLINLMVNARDAMPDGGDIILTSRPPTPEEERRYDLKTGRYIVLAVIDEGTGVPEEHVEHILESFHTTKEHGTGLGLSMVKNYTDQAGGVLTFENNSGHGATFAMILPIETTRDFRLDVVAEMQPDMTKQTSEVTVLILEDEVELLTVLTSLLEGWGYKCIGCRSLDEARKYHESSFEDPHIILTDLNLGDGYGDLLLSSRFWRWGGIPKILMSGNMESAGKIVDVTQFFAFIMKPFEVDQISSILSEALIKQALDKVDCS